MKIIIYLQEIIIEVKEWLNEKVFKKYLKVCKQKENEIIKWYSYYQIMLKWTRMKEKDKSITEYFEGKYKRIGIYGCGELGKLCYDELVLSEQLEITFFIDKNVEGSYKNVMIIKPEELKKDADAILITPVHCYLEIANELCQYTKVPFVSLEDVVEMVESTAI